MKKPKTIGYYQKVIKKYKQQIDIYENTLAYLVDAADIKELETRMKEYKDLLDK
tara:strand:+ start:736 stop:897 length:162 start_codon:yes stop_codon:yes gene_type:complete